MKHTSEVVSMSSKQAHFALSQFPEKWLTNTPNDVKTSAVCLIKHITVNIN